MSIETVLSSLKTLRKDQGSNPQKISLTLINGEKLNGLVVDHFDGETVSLSDSDRSSSEEAEMGRIRHAHENKRDGNAGRTIVRVEHIISITVGP